MDDPRSLKPVFGVTGLTSGHNKARRTPELLVGRVNAIIETQGARLAWSRATTCPCQGFNDQTRHPDPTCARCHRGGVLYFGPKDYRPPSDAGKLTRLQELILEDDGAAVIRGIIQRVSQAQDFYDMVGNWVRGTMQVTVRPENKIGYYDRLVNLDAEVPFSEVVTAGQDRYGNVTSASSLRLRYRATGVNAVFTEVKRFEQGEDFELDEGVVQWISGREPLPGTRLSVHYLTHPTWLVIDHPHVLRETQQRRKIREKVSPLGSPVALPIQASVRLEFLPPREIPPPLPP